MTDAPDNDQASTTRPQQDVSMVGSHGLWNWLKSLQISIAFTTYQTSRLFLIGCKPEGRLANAGELTVKYQQVYQLNTENLAAFDAMTYPSQQARWLTQPQRGELLGVSASVAREMEDFAVAESFLQANSEQAAELLSLFVLPGYRHQGIGTALAGHLKQLIGKPLVR